MIILYSCELRLFSTDQFDEEVDCHVYKENIIEGHKGGDSCDIHGIKWWSQDRLNQIIVENDEANKLPFELMPYYCWDNQHVNWLLVAIPTSCLPIHVKLLFIFIYIIFFRYSHKYDQSTNLGLSIFFIFPEFIIGSARLELILVFLVSLNFLG